MPSALLHLVIPLERARDALEAALSAEGYAVSPTITGSLAVSRERPAAPAAGGEAADVEPSAPFDLRFDVRVTAAGVGGGAIATFDRPAVGGYFDGGATVAGHPGDPVREAADRVAARLAEQGLLAGGTVAPGADGASPHGFARPAQAVRTNPVSIVALVLGFVLPVIGIVVGVVALRQVARTGERGRGFAITGIVAGSALTVVSAVAVGVIATALVSLNGPLATGDPIALPSVSADGGATVAPGGTDPADLYAFAVGECLDDLGGEYLSTDNFVDCDQPHTYEVFGAFTLPDATFPGDKAVSLAAEQMCDAAFADFVGVAYGDSELGYTYFAPVQETWSDGDRSVSCLISDPANGPVAGSLAGAHR